MASATLTNDTSIVLVESGNPNNMPFIVYCPELSNVGKLITIRDVDGFVSSGNPIVISTIDTGTFYEFDNPIEINQPYGFVTLFTTIDGDYGVTNTYALPSDAENYTSNIYTENTLIKSSIEFLDIENGEIKSFYISSGQVLYNNEILGDVDAQELESTVTHLGSLGYVSTLPTNVPAYPSIWITTGITSNQQVAPNKVSTTIGSIQYSFTGSNYSSAASGGFYQYGTALTYGNGYFVAVGANCSSVSLLDKNTGFIQHSRDGSNWTNSTAPILDHSSIRTAVSFGSNIFHAVGNYPHGGNSTILYSLDAQTWVPSVTAGDIPFRATDLVSGYATGVTFGNGIWVCSGSQNIQASPWSLLYSDDGSNWNPAQSLPFTNRLVNDVAFDGLKFMALGRDAPAPSENLVYSLNGSNWLNNDITGATFGNAGKYITGYGGTWIVTLSLTTNYIYYSSNGGSNWFQSTGLPANGVAGKAYFDGSKWLIGISTPTSAASIYQTTNLATWTNTGITSGFTNNGTATSFVKSPGFCNDTGYYDAYLNFLAGDVNAQNLNVNTISTGTLETDILRLSSLFTNVTTVQINNQVIEIISSVRTNLYSTAIFSSGNTFISSISTLSIVNVQNMNVQNLRYVNELFSTISADETINQNLELNSDSVILGLGAGGSSSSNVVTIGQNAGVIGQGSNTIAIGDSAGIFFQSSFAVAIGFGAGNISQGDYSIAIGQGAGGTNQPPSSIIISAIAGSLDPNNRGFYVRPIRDTNETAEDYPSLSYNISTSEVLQTFGTTGTNTQVSSISFSTIVTSTLVVNFQNPAHALNVFGVAQIAQDNKQFQFGGATASNGMTMSFNTLQRSFNGEFIIAKPSLISGGGIDFYTGIGNMSTATASNFTMTIQQSRVGINISSPSHNLDIVGILRAASTISTAAYFTSTINGSAYLPQSQNIEFTTLNVSSLTVTSTIHTSSLITEYLSVNTLTVNGPTIFNKINSLTRPDLETQTLNFYTSGQSTIDTSKNYIQTTTRAIIFNSTLSVNLSTNRVGINMSTPTQSLDVRGNIFVTSTIFAADAILDNGTVITSDSNIKKDITPANLQMCFNTVKNIPLKHFSYKAPFNEGRRDQSILGFVAQDVQPIFPRSIRLFYDTDTQRDIMYLSKDQILMSHYGATQAIMERVEINSTVLESLFDRIQSLSEKISTLNGGNV
jgi:hypothetical protein